MSFNLTKSDRIVIYGASALAVEWAKEAIEKGFHILAFLDRDKRKTGIIHGVKVFTPENWKSEQERNIIVIIMLQNALNHDGIAKMLYQKYIKKIIFFPIETLNRNSKNVECLRGIYNTCIHFDFADEIKNIPEYQELNEKKIKEDGIINEFQGEISVWSPVEICYAEEQSALHVQNDDYTDESKNLADIWINGKNLYKIRPYWELFEYLKGEREDCSLYLKIFGKEGHKSDFPYDNERFLDGRNELFILYMNEYNVRSKFFETSPAEARVDPNGKIYIKDGLHRSIFLLSAGNFWVPVRVKKSYLEKLGIKKIAEQYKKYLTDKGITKLKNPIEHYTFWKFPVERAYLRKLWGEIIRQTDLEEMKENVVWDLSLSDGFFSRNFLRMGIKRNICFVKHNDTSTAMLNKMFNMEQIELIYENVSNLKQKFNKTKFAVINAELILDKRIPYNFLLTQKCIVLDVPLCYAEEVFKHISNDKREIRQVMTYIFKGKVNKAFFIN